MARSYPPSSPPKRRKYSRKAPIPNDPQTASQARLAPSRLVSGLSRIGSSRRCDRAELARLYEEHNPISENDCEIEDLEGEMKNKIEVSTNLVVIAFALVVGSLFLKDRLSTAAPESNEVKAGD